MTKRPIQIRATERLIQQIKDLQTWWGNATQVDVVSEAVSRVWAQETARRGQYAGAPWMVAINDGPRRYFSCEDAAIQWMSRQGARQVGPGEWAVYDEDGDGLFYDVEPLKLEGVE